MEEHIIPWLTWKYHFQSSCFETGPAKSCNICNKLSGIFFCDHVSDFSFSDIYNPILSFPLQDTHELLLGSWIIVLFNQNKIYVWLRGFTVKDTTLILK